MMAYEKPSWLPSFNMTPTLPFWLSGVDSLGEFFSRFHSDDDDDDDDDDIAHL